MASTVKQLNEVQDLMETKNGKLKCPSPPLCKKPIGLSGLYKKEREKFKEKLRNSLGEVSRETIRRERIKYADAICLEMEESGFSESAAYVRSLIQLNEEIRNSYGPDTWIWIQPQLQTSKDKLDILRQALIEAEEADRMGNIVLESELLVKVAIHFMNLPKGWWWLAEELFIKCINIVETLKSDGGEHEANIRYIFGHFLFYQLEDPKEAHKHLTRARELSIGKNWEVLYPELKKESLYLHCCNILARVDVQKAISEKLTDPLKATRSCHIALKRAMESNDVDVICYVLMELGHCHLVTGELHLAENSFLKYIKYCMDNKNFTGVCAGSNFLAQTYVKLGKFSIAESTLQDSIEISRANDLKYQEALSEQYLGQIYLDHNLPEKATLHLINSFKMFFNLDRRNEQEQSRILGAISSATELWHNYVKLLLSCNRKDVKMKNISMLCLWKGHRSAFWNTVDDLQIKNSSIFIQEQQYTPVSVANLPYLNLRLNKTRRKSLQHSLPQNNCK